MTPASVFTLKNTDTGVTTDQVLSRIDFEQTDVGDPGVTARISHVSNGNNGAGMLEFFTGSTVATLRERLKIADGGDISFYEDTGTTAKLFWDASAESLEVDGQIGITNFNALKLGTAHGGGASIAYAGDGNLKVNPRSGFSTVFESGNVGIGTDSPDTLLHLSDATGGAVIRLERQDIGIVVTDVYGSIEFEGQDQSSGASGVRGSISGISESTSGGMGIVFSTAPSGGSNTERMRIDSSGNLLVGQTSAYTGAGVTISGDGVVQAERNNISGVFNRTSTDGDIVQFRKDGSTVGSIASVGGADIKVSFSSDGDQYITGNAAANYLSFSSANAERMRLDSIGRLLIGKTVADSIGTDGIELDGANDRVLITRSDSEPLVLNRKTSDGDIAIFRKDGTAVGSIGVIASDNLYIAGNAGSTKGVYFNNTSMLPCSSGGTLVDNTVDIGKSDYRYKDLYLSGGVYLGGTGSANKLDDYEEGDHTTSITCSTSGTVTLNTTFDSVSYVKIGQLVTVTGLVIVGSVSSPVGNFKISMPFAVAGSGVAKRGSDSAAAITVHNSVSANSSDYVSNIGVNESALSIYLGDDPDIQSDSAQQLQTGTQIYFHVTYRTA